jgi:hypothetical protein
MRKQPKKLALNTETLRNLDGSRLKEAAGGTIHNTVCNTCDCSATYVCSDCRPCL